MGVWHEVSRRGTEICIQGNCFLKLSGGRAASLFHFLEQSLRLCLIILIDQFRLVRYNDFIFLVSDCVNWVSFSAGELTSLMRVWADSLSFQSLLEIKAVSFCYRHLSLTPEMYPRIGQPLEPGCVLGKGLCGPGLGDVGRCMSWGRTRRHLSALSCQGHNIYSGKLSEASWPPPNQVPCSPLQMIAMPGGSSSAMS